MFMATPPGFTVVELMEDRGIGEAELAFELGLNLSEMTALLQGNLGLSLRLALGLERVFEVPRTFWLNYERTYREKLEKEKECLDTLFQHVVRAKESGEAWAEGLLKD